MAFKSHWIVALGAAVALAACSTPKQESTSTEVSTTGNAQSSAVTTENQISTTSVDDTNVIRPGSLDDFALNVPDRVFFGYDRYDLSMRANETLDTQVRWLQQYLSLIHI